MSSLFLLSICTVAWSMNGKGTHAQKDRQIDRHTNMQTDNTEKTRVMMKTSYLRVSLRPKMH